jgi:hypothetical protein
MVFSAIGFLIAGFIQNAFVVFPIVLVLMIGTLFIIKKFIVPRAENAS